MRLLRTFAIIGALQVSASVNVLSWGAGVFVLSLDKIVCGPKIKQLPKYPQHVPLVSIEAMFGLLRIFVGVIVRLFCSRRSLLIENLASRQQLAVFKRQTSRPNLGVADKLFWVTQRRF
jgi:hypothetical protein